MTTFAHWCSARRKRQWPSGPKQDHRSAVQTSQKRNLWSSCNTDNGQSLGDLCFWGTKDCSLPACYRLHAAQHSWEHSFIDTQSDGKLTGSVQTHSAQCTHKENATVRAWCPHSPFLSHGHNSHWQGCRVTQAVIYMVYLQTEPTKDESKWGQVGANSKVKRHQEAEHKETLSVVRTREEREGTLLTSTI